MEAVTHLYKCPNFAANLNKMRLNKKWCDITINVNGTDFHAHKVILAANLKYFATQLSNESSQEGKYGIITLQSLEPADVEAFIRYAYTGEILFTKHNALNLMEAANYFSEDGIKTACILFLDKHLTVKEACRAYKFADAIDCIPLKTAAKALITSNFGNCSKTTDYLNFNYEDLIDILSDGKVQPVKQQQMFFEGILRWIMYNTNSRKMHINDLFNLIDIPTLTADFLIYCLHRNIDRDDEHGIIKDTIFRYHTSQIEEKEREKLLLIVGFNASCNCSALLLQSYNFMKKRWTSLQEAVPGAIDEIPRSSSVVLYSKVYYISTNLDVNSLQVFDPTTNEIMEVNPSSSIFRSAAVCACSKFLYLCGGIDKDHNVTNEVLRYDPLTNSFENLTTMGTKRTLATAIICRDFLFILGGFDGSSDVDSVEKYDLQAKQWTEVASMPTSRHSYGLAVQDQKLYVSGGVIHGRATNIVEVYDPVQNRWQSVSSMNIPRDTFFVIAHEGTLLAVGGDAEQSIEVYHPSKDQWQLDHEMSAGFQMKHPIGGFIQSSSFSESN